jgi:hypothetical protein
MTMSPFLQMAVTVVCAVLASSGFWAYLQARHEKKDAKTKMLLGLGHDRIVALAMSYIERGWITQDEYEDLNKYLYNPYREMGGNGTAERLMTEIKKLPIHHISYAQQAKENASE